MNLPVSLDRRRAARAPLAEARRRFPRISVALDAFYESDARALLATRVELSLRGAFLPTHSTEPEGTRGTLRLALPEGPMLRAQVEVVRSVDGRRPGLVLRFVELGEPERLRLAAFLVRTGGLSVIPALERRFGGWAQMPHAGLRRELRRSARPAAE
jgi:hypothetical protein